MAGVVWFDGTRLNDAETATGWSNDGATVTQENDFKYQGTFSVSCALKANTEAGYYYTSAAQNFSANNGTWLAKFVLTNKDALNGNGLRLKIGSTAAAYYLYTIYSGATSINTFYNYPAVGGFQVIPINPNKTEYLRTPTGTPNLASITIFGIRAQTLTAAKSANLGMDAVDWFPNGKGLSLSGTSSSFNDFVTFDEVTLTNRYGVVLTKEGILYVTGTLTIGNNNLTTFSDADKTLVFPYGRFDTGFCGVNFNLAHTGSTVDISAISMIGRGFTGSTDTRPIFVVQSLTGGTVSLNGMSFTTFNYFNLNTKATITNTVFNTCGYVIQSGATLTSCNFNDFTTGSTILSNDPSKITYCNFRSDGSNHAIQITSTGTYNFIGNTFENYSTAISGTTGNEAIYNTSGGLVTLNVSAGDTPSYRNGAGSSTTINNNVAVTLTGMKDNTEVRVFAAGTTTELAGIENATDGTINNRSFTFLLAVGVHVDYRLVNFSYIIIEIYDYIIPALSTSLPIQQQSDRWVV
jgi:hypothetical protein